MNYTITKHAITVREIADRGLCVRRMELRGRNPAINRVANARFKTSSNQLPRTYNYPNVHRLRLTYLEGEGGYIKITIIAVSFKDSNWSVFYDSDGHRVGSYETKGPAAISLHFLTDTEADQYTSFVEFIKDKASLLRLIADPEIIEVPDDDEMQVDAIRHGESEEDTIE